MREMLDKNAFRLTTPGYLSEYVDVVLNEEQAAYWYVCMSGMSTVYWYVCMYVSDALYLIVTIICGYYILRIFAIWKKIAKLSTSKNFYQHIRHHSVYNHKLRDA